LYSLLDFANFKVDPNTGWITANRVFDRETRDSYQVTVIASDQGVPQLSSSVLLNLTILDRNDHAPRLVTNRDQSRGSPGRRTSGNQFVVDENAPANTFIGTLEAVDEDSAENAQLHYQLMAENEPLLKTRFSLLANGSLFTAVTLDREEQANKSLTNPLSTTATVTIIVRDLNDNPPEFIRPKELIHTTFDFD
uniref:Cadherin domain-containing protein n=1 Tax=Echinostoma caproni TaxID=27848 RepID=A0A182ZZH1_9TREM